MSSTALRAPEQSAGETAIPVIDLGPYLAGGAGRARGDGRRAARRPRRASGSSSSSTTGCRAPSSTARSPRPGAFTTSPLDAKMALRMNEHNNGYMAMGRYAVWTSEVNTNDQARPERGLLLQARARRRRPAAAFGPALRRPEPLARRLARFSRARCSRIPAPSTRSARRLLPVVRRRARPAAGLFRRSVRGEPVLVPAVALSARRGRTPTSSASRRTPTPTSSRSSPRPRCPACRSALPSGEWLDVPYVPGSFAVNSGDMMSRWTNGRFKSTPHRALPPVGRHRYAIPFFLGPHIDTVIDCLPTCQGPDNPPRFPPITYEAYLHLVVRRELQCVAPARPRLTGRGEATTRCISASSATMWTTARAPTSWRAPRRTAASSRSGSASTRISRRAARRPTRAAARSRSPTTTWPTPSCR